MVRPFESQANICRNKAVKMSYLVPAAKIGTPPLQRYIMIWRGCLSWGALTSPIRQLPSYDPLPSHLSQLAASPLPSDLSIQYHRRTLYIIKFALMEFWHDADQAQITFERERASDELGKYVHRRLRRSMNSEKNIGKKGHTTTDGWLSVLFTNTKECR